MLRKTDIAYLIFFTTHLPIIYLIDTAPLQPTWAVTSLSTTLRTFYVNTYRDKFFESPTPAWFSAFIWMEVLYHVPASLWAVWGLLKGECSRAELSAAQRGSAKLPSIEALPNQTKSSEFANHISSATEHPLIPVHILIFGVQAFITSLTCLVEVWAWEDRSTVEKQNITALYGPYVALGMLKLTPHHTAAHCTVSRLDWIIANRRRVK